MRSTRETNNTAIQAQDTVRQMKEELTREKGLENATEEFTDGLYYHDMYFSEACWKDDPRVVERNLKKLKSEMGKYNSLKENILIRVKGFGWEWCRHAWPKKMGESTQLMSLPISYAEL